MLKTAEGFQHFNPESSLDSGENRENPNDFPGFPRNDDQFP
jgi:hypothetical protein